MQSSLPPFNPSSPCVGVCESDSLGVCQGCYRNLDEITRWFEASPSERLEIIQSAETRKETAANTTATDDFGSSDSTGSASAESA